MTKVFMFCPIFNIQNPFIRKNHEVIREVADCEVNYFEVIGVSVEHSKSIAYKKFLETDCDYFFNVDADISFLEPDKSPIDTLISNGKEIVGGIYVYKRPPCLPTHRPLDLQESYEKNGKFPEDYKFNIPNEIHEVKWLSGGCMMISRKVIEELTKEIKVPNLPMIYKDEYLSEDYSFCQRAIEKGYKIYADSTINLAHFGNYGYTLKDYNQYISR